MASHESEGKRLKPTPLPHMRLWLGTSYNLKIRASKFPKVWLMVPWNPCQDHG